jgi:tol-pal system protein YbgF
VINTPPSTYAAGKAFFDKGKYVRAMATLKRFLASAPKGTSREKAHFLLAESYYANQDFALAALEFNKYKRAYPRSKNLPNAIYRQASSFKNMGKKTEAKLFYQELIDRYPKHPLTKKAKRDIKTVR